MTMTVAIVKKRERGGGLLPIVALFRKAITGMYNNGNVGSQMDKDRHKYTR